MLCHAMLEGGVVSGARGLVPQFARSTIHFNSGLKKILKGNPHLDGIIRDACHHYNVRNLIVLEGPRGTKVCSDGCNGPTKPCHIVQCALG